MADISATLVKQLRDKTGSPMGKCKEALVASNGDIPKAIEWLRSQGVKLDVLTRATGEGAMVAKVSPDGKKVALIELKCETDFAAKNDRFKKLAENIADAALAAQATDATKLLEAKIGDETVDKAIKAEISGVIKENIKLDWCTFKELQGPGKIGTYVHGGKLAVVVGMSAPNDAAAQKPEFDAALKDVAMHIAGSSPFPIAWDRAGVPKDLVDAERAFVLKQLNEDPKESKKPDNIKEKIAEGKMGRFYKERVLGEQAFVKDDSKTVDQVLADVGKAIGGAPKVSWFIRRPLGG